MKTYRLKGKLIAGIVALVLPVAVYAASLLYQATPPTIKWNKSSVQELTLTTNATLTFSGGKVGERYTLVVLQDAVGGRAITWPADVQWPEGVTPLLTNAPNSTDVFEFLFDGTRYLGSVTKNYRATPPTSGLNAGLIHYWKLDESSGDAFDSFGSMTMSNVNSTLFAPAKISNGANFVSTSNQYLYSPANLSASMLTSFTTSFWYRPDVQPATNQAYGLFSHLNSSGQFAIFYRDIAGDKQLRFYAADAAGNTRGMFPSMTLTNGTWYLVTASWDGSIMRLYVDGVDVGITDILPNMYTLDTRGTFIGATESTAEFAGGSIDEVGFWTRALSPSEISQLYNGGAGRTYPF